MKATGFGWAAMTVLASMIAAYAAFVLLVPGFGPPFIAELRARLPWAVMAHLAGGLVAMAVGPWQFSTRLRARAVNVHRWLGRGYVVAVLIGGIGALVLAPTSQEGLVTHVGFGLLAVLWLNATVQAYRSIRAGDVSSHRRWMIRSFSLILAGVMLRVWRPLYDGLAALGVVGFSFETAYAGVAWLCWVPNLVVAELWIMRQHPVAAPAPA